MKSSRAGRARAPRPPATAGSRATLRRRARQPGEGEQGQQHRSAADDARRGEIVDRLSMKLAGRKWSESTRRRRGRAAARRAPPPRPGHLERVGAGELLDHEQQAGAVVDDGVADQRLVVLDHVGDVAEAQLAGRRRPPRSGPAPGRSGVAIGRTCRTPSRWFGVSMNPPVPGVDASRKLSGETHSALPVVSMTCSSVTSVSLQPLRVDLHLELALALAPDRRRWPRPGRPSGAAGSSSGRAPHISIRDSFVGREPDHHHPAGRRQRLEHLRRLGDVAAAALRLVRRSCTTCRARRRSVPGSKISAIDDSPGTDSERISSRNATPLGGRPRAER